MKHTLLLGAEKAGVDGATKPGAERRSGTSRQHELWCILRPPVSAPRSKVTVDRKECRVDRSVGCAVRSVCTRVSSSYRPAFILLDDGALPARKSRHTKPADSERIYLSGIVQVWAAPPPCDWRLESITSMWGNTLVAGDHRCSGEDAALTASQSGCTALFSSPI